MVLYVLVAVSSLGAVGAGPLAEATRQTGAPLEEVARSLSIPGLPGLVTLGATVAMLGVILNLILGLSRVALAMGRRGDLPRSFASVRADGRAPVPATVLVSAIVLGLVLVGDIRTTWTFSAFAVLVYYAITNLAALRLPEESRSFPRALSYAGLAGCLFLALWIEAPVALAGIVLVVTGVAWHSVARRHASRLQV